MQSFRSYATEGSRSKSRTASYVGLALVPLVGYGIWRGNPNIKKATTDATKDVKDKTKSSEPPKPVFTGGDQGFVDLKLAEVEDVSHNTKRFRFEFPEKDQVSGLHIACT